MSSGLLKLLAPRTPALFVASTLAASAAFAQAPPAPSANNTGGSGGLEEVTVTAQFQQQSVQTTPLAITAVNAEALAARGQTSVTEIARDAPSVQLNQESGASGPSMSAYIRGIGQSDLDPALEPGVGIYIDDVYFGTLTGSMFDLLDLDRVEVLRGPQGTLEGMNSEGGAIKLFSKKPDSTESMSFDLLVGSRNHVELRAGTNFAIGDNLFVRLSGVGNHQEGYVTRYNFACANPSFTATDINGVTGTYSVLPGFPAQTSSCQLGHEGGTGYAGGRIAVRWLPADKLEFNLVADMTNENQEFTAETLGYAGPGPLVGNAAAGSASAAGVSIPTTNGHLLPYNEALVPQIIAPNFYASYANFCMPAPSPVTPPGGIPGLGGNNDQQAYCVPPNMTVNNWGVSLTSDWGIADNLSLKSITAMRGYSAQWVHDNDVSIWPLDLGAESMGHHQFSEELRLSGTFNHFLDWTAGAYYFRENTVYFGHEDLSYAFIFTGFPNLLNFYQNDPIEAHDKAGFLHTTFHVTQKLDAIFGIRYTTQDKTYNYVRLAPDGTTTGDSAAAVSPLNGASSEYRANRWDWRANLSYHFTDDLMTYAQYSTGFKGGGVDPRPFYLPQAIQFNPESLSTYELGFKSSWFNNHLHANLDGYFSQYRNMQLTLANCSSIPSIAAATAAAAASGVPVNYGSPCALPYNAGAGHQKGVEFETQAAFGGLQIDANLSWLKFEYVYVNPVTGITPDETPPYTPSWSGGAGVQYSLPVGSLGTFTARIDGSTRSSIYTAAQNSPYNLTAGYTVYNAHLTWEAPKGNWQAIVQAKNLTGKRYYFGQFDLVSAGQGTQINNPAPPLEIDLELKHQM